MTQTQTQDETTLAQLNALIALFSPGPHTWTQGVFARDAFNERIDEGSELATCWCMIGGINKTIPSPHQQYPVRNAIQQHLPEYAGHNLVNFNDNAQTTYEAFMLVLYKAQHTVATRVAAVKGEV